MKSEKKLKRTIKKLTVDCLRISIDVVRGNFCAEECQECTTAIQAMAAGGTGGGVCQELGDLKLAACQAYELAGCDGPNPDPTQCTELGNLKIAACDAWESAGCDGGAPGA